MYRQVKGMCWPNLLHVFSYLVMPYGIVEVGSSSLVQVIAPCLFDTKPLPELMLAWFNKILLKIQTLSIRKVNLIFHANGDHFVQTLVWEITFLWIYKIKAATNCHQNIEVCMKWHTFNPKPRVCDGPKTGSHFKKILSCKLNLGSHWVGVPWSEWEGTRLVAPTLATRCHA